MNAQPSNLKAALWMAGWLAAMLVLIVAGRETTREITVFQVMEMRSVLGLVMLYPLIHFAGGFRAMKTSRPLMHLARNTVHYGSQYGWFAAITLIPIAQVVSIEFTMPIWTALLAFAFLGEKMTVWKNLAIAFGLAGVLIIVRPGASEINHGQIIMVVSAVGFGASIAMVKSLTRTESTVTIIFWMLVIQSIIGLWPAWHVWQWPSAYVWFWIVPIAFCGRCNRSDLPARLTVCSGAAGLCKAALLALAGADKVATSSAPVSGAAIASASPTNTPVTKLALNTVIFHSIRTSR